jgi:cytochrome c biogenesis protein CcdA
MKTNGRLFLGLSMLFLQLAAMPGAQALAAVQAEYYGEIGCAHCDDFAGKILPEAEAREGVAVDLDVHDILAADGYDRCKSRLSTLGYDFTIFPVLVIGNNVYQGNAAIEANLVPELEYYARTGEFLPRAVKPARASRGLRLAALPIFLAGLVDGINPCAFTTLLFFLSFLSLRGGTRRRMAFAGLLFAAGVFVAYFLIGLGLFNAMRAGSRVASLRLALRVAMTCLTAAFCCLTVRDILLIRKGRHKEMTLQLPDAVKRRIHASIRTGVRSAAFFLGVFASGVVVAVLELACTGQIYFPTISFMVQTDGSWLGIASLALYNLAFIAPLLILLALTLLGTSQEVVRAFFQRHLALSKAALAVVFAALTVLVWIY